MTRPPATGAQVRGLAPLAAVCVVAAFVLAATRGLPSAFGDLRVWQEAVADWLAGTSPYQQTYVAGLTFNYPPSALPLLAPLAALPALLAGTLLVVVGMLVIARMVRVAVPGLALPAVGLSVAVLALSEPALATFSQGQLGYVLLVAMTAATLPRTGRWTGPLIGLGAGLKVYPLAALALEPRGRMARTVAVAAGVVVLLTTVAALRLPGVLLDWWTQLRAGGVLLRPGDRVRNQSWRGLLDAALGDGPAASALWVLVVVVLVWLALLALREARRADDRLSALVVVLLLTVLVSPVSWTHYWVFLPLLLGTVAPAASSRAERVHRLLVLSLLLAAQAFVVWVPTALGDGSATAGGGWVLTYAYVLLGSAVLVSLWTQLRSRRSPRPAGTAPTA